MGELAPRPFVKSSPKNATTGNAVLDALAIAGRVAPVLPATAVVSALVGELVAVTIGTDVAEAAGGKLGDGVAAACAKVDARCSATTTKTRATTANAATTATNPRLYMGDRIRLANLRVQGRTDGRDLAVRRPPVCHSMFAMRVADN